MSLTVIKIYTSIAFAPGNDCPASEQARQLLDTIDAYVVYVHPR